MLDPQYWTSGVKTICQTVLLIRGLICWWVSGFVSWWTDGIDVQINAMQELARVGLDFSWHFCGCCSQCDAQFTKTSRYQMNCQVKSRCEVVLRFNLSFCWDGFILWFNKKLYCSI